MSIVNLLARAAIFCTSAGEILAMLPPSGQVARAVPGDALPARAAIVESPDLEIPVTCYAPPVRVESLPDDPAVPILIPVVVADAMRALGLRRVGAVYSPMPLVYHDGKPVGTSGLILHEDLTAIPRSHGLVCD